ncbi:MAG TPA: DUF3795 domain-containing protein [Polyangia bacterium]|jgi:hypothetical protein
MTVMSRPDPAEHIAPCGLFCTNCPKLAQGKCQGCQVAPGFERCEVRRCCIAKGILTCASCPDFAPPRSYRECGKLNSFIARAIGFFMKSDRCGAVQILRDEGVADYLALKRASGHM